MLSRVIELSLRFRGLVIALACLVMAYGLFVATRTNLDVFPEFAPPQIVIQTEAPGLSPEEVEQLVTRPLEAALNGSPQLEAIRSQSIQGLSAIVLVFRENADILQVRQLVSERLNEVAGEFPQGVKAPKMGPLTSSTGLFLVLGLTSSNRTAMELRTFADWTLRPHLLGVPGVAKVDIFGGDVRQLQVQVKSEQLVAFDLALTDVLDAARHATAIRGAGFVENANQRVVLRTEGQSLTADKLGEAVVAHHNGASVRLRDVADVREGAEPKFGDAQVNGERGVILLLWTQYGANTLEVTAAVENALEEMRPTLAAEKITLNPRVFRPASFIETSLGNIRFSLLLGAVLVVGVLFLFLLDLRTALISFVSIPLSLLAAVIVLDRLGVSLNTLTLGGFAIAIGVVVDDAIIDVENIMRRLRENLALSERRPLFRVVLDASLEVRSAVVYATFIVALVFVPVLTMSGVSGRIFAPLATAFVLATLASLVVALTVTPALCYLLLSRVPPHNEPGYVGWLKTKHRLWLESGSGYPRTIVGLAVLLCAGAAATVPFFGGEFLPEFREGHLIVHMAMTPGTALEESLRLGHEVTLELLANKHVRGVAQQAGRAENGEDTWGTHLSEFHVDLNPVSGEEAEFIPAELREALLKFPGATFKIMPFLVERMEETISGASAQIVVNLYGDNLTTLDTAAAQVRRVLTELRGAVDVQVESEPAAPEVVARLRHDQLRQFGFRSAEVLDAVQTAYQGSDVAQVFDGHRVHDVSVILHPRERRDPESLGALIVRSSDGLRMPLGQLADITPGRGRYVVVHEGGRRRQQITCNVAGRDAASFLAEAQRHISHANLAAGVRAVFGGSAVAQKEARNELLLHSVLAGVGIVLLLWVVFRSGRNLLLVLANLPFALVGGVLAIFAGGGLLSIGSLVGLVTLFGLTMRNSIMLVSHWEHLVRVEGQPWGLDTAIRGANERLLPILMTVLVTALGLLPIAMSAGEAGHEIEGPMAIVILGGLVTSTALNLLVLPALAARFGDFRPSIPSETT